MSPDREIDILAGELRTSIGLLLRRLRQAQADGELTLPETAALARLDRGGPATSAELRGPSRSARSRWARPSPRSRRAAWSAARPTRPTAGGWSCRVTTPACRCCATAAARAPRRWRRRCRSGFTADELEQLLARRAAARATGAEHLMRARGAAVVVDDRYKWVALSNTTLAVFMAALDGSIVIIALPAIFRGIHLDPLEPGQHQLPAVDDHGLPARAGRAGGHARPARATCTAGCGSTTPASSVFTVASILLSFDPFHGRPGRAVADRLAAAAGRSAGRC